MYHHHYGRTDCQSYIPNVRQPVFIRVPAWLIHYFMRSNYALLSVYLPEFISSHLQYMTLA